MNNEERDLITRFVERVAGPQASPSGFGGSVPSTTAVAPLPPVDRDADTLLADLFARYPEARYRITQMAFVEEHALIEAQNRINRLQWELQQVRQQAQAAAPQQAGGAPWGGGAPPQQAPRGLFGSLFGGASRPPPPQYQQQPPQYAPPPPQYPPNYNPGLFQQQGPGFFGSALRTAAGVAGGVVAADALMSLFSGRQGGGFGGGFGGGMGGFGAPGYVVEPAANPWTEAAAPPVADPYDVGGAAKDGGGDTFAGGPPVDDQGGWTPDPGSDPGGDQGGWDQASDDPGGDIGGDSGWSDSGSDNLG
jgi:hypothetical protein